MNIASTQYNSSDRAFEIYLSGCDGFCGDDCHNKELWDYKLGDPWRVDLPYIISKIDRFSNLIDSIWVLGGEPLLHDDIYMFLRVLSGLGKKIYLFTRFDFEEIDKEILSMVDFIKCGHYNRDKVEEDYYSKGIKLATSNQAVYEKGVDY